MKKTCEVCGGRGHEEVAHTFVDATPKGEAKPKNI